MYFECILNGRVLFVQLSVDIDVLKYLLILRSVRKHVGSDIVTLFVFRLSPCHVGLTEGHVITCSSCNVTASPLRSANDLSLPCKLYIKTVKIIVKYTSIRRLHPESVAQSDCRRRSPFRNIPSKDARRS